MINVIKQQMMVGQPAMGIVLDMGSPIVAGLLARSGFDFILVDYQHGDWDDTTALAAFPRHHFGCFGPGGSCAPE